MTLWHRADLKVWKLNGLDYPSSVVSSPNVRMEMERALADLQEMILANEAELAADDRSD